MVPILVSMSDAGYGPDTQADYIFFWVCCALILISTGLLVWEILRNKS